VSENFSFINPLPHFDPVGSGQPAPACLVKSVVVDLVNDSFPVKY
jgi:hypothetical protein